MTLWSRIRAIVLLAVCVVVTAGGVAAPPALADGASVVTVVGGSAAYDSFLVQSVIKPGFEAANPGITLNYIAKGTGAAAAFAETGAASAMLGSAPALENQFVNDGYSLEPSGRAVFWGDYVLVGPASDPAGVLNGGNPSGDISAAFQKIAAAGSAGRADFVSRGGTPGSTVQEHAIWKTTTGSTTCTVSSTAGGGASPYNGTGSGCGVPGTYPSWYHATGLTSGPNIVNGNTCNYVNGHSGAAPDCYLFTDRGSFEYLQSVGQATHLKVMVRARTSGTPAQTSLMIEPFHAYAVNPAKFDSQTAAGINTNGAVKFLNYLTSPAAQSAIRDYLDSNGDGDAPYLAAATPGLTIGPLPAAVPSGGRLQVTGLVTNTTLSTPHVQGATVQLLAQPSSSSTPQLVATTTTNDKGAFTLFTSPSATQSYTVKVPPFNQVERPDLTPAFADSLTGVSQSLGSIRGGPDPNRGNRQATPRNGPQTGYGPSPRHSGPVYGRVDPSTGFMQLPAAPRATQTSLNQCAKEPSTSNCRSVTLNPTAQDTPSTTPPLPQDECYLVPTLVLSRSVTCTRTAEPVTVTEIVRGRPTVVGTAEISMDQRIVLSSNQPGNIEIDRRWNFIRGTDAAQNLTVSDNLVNLGAGVQDAPNSTTESQRDINITNKQTDWVSAAWTYAPTNPDSLDFVHATTFLSVCLTGSSSACSRGALSTSFHSPVLRCDSTKYLQNGAGCVFGAYPAVFQLSKSIYPDSAGHILRAQQALSNHPGRSDGIRLLRMKTPDYMARNNAEKNKICKRPATTGKGDCDEYPFASTWQGCAGLGYVTGSPYDPGPDYCTVEKINATDNQQSGNQLNQFYRRERILDDELPYHTENVPIAQGNPGEPFDAGFYVTITD